MDSYHPRFNPKRPSLAYNSSMDENNVFLSLNPRSFFQGLDFFSDCSHCLGSPHFCVPSVAIKRVDATFPEGFTKDILKVKESKGITTLFFSSSSAMRFSIFVTF